MRSKIYYRYSENFKKEVVRQIQEEGLGVGAARRRYGIGGSMTIHRWVKQYGKTSLLSTKIVIMKAEEQKEEQRLKARIAQLEAALIELQLKHLASDSYLRVACEDLGISYEEFKKKVDHAAIAKASKDKRN